MGWGVLSLTDFFTSPSECQQSADAYHTAMGCEINQLNVEQHGLFSLPLSVARASSQQRAVELTAGQWTNITLSWDLSRRTCRVEVVPAGVSLLLHQLPIQPDRRYSGHVSYLRLRTVAPQQGSRLLVRKLSARSLDVGSHAHAGANRAGWQNSTVELAHAEKKVTD